MNDIEQKSMALWNKVGVERGYTYEPTSINRADEMDEALCRAIEQHEAFRQEVSKVMTYIKALYPTLPTDYDRFIIPAPKPDPLAEIMEDIGWVNTAENAAKLRAALEARGLEIREKNDD